MNNVNCKYYKKCGNCQLLNKTYTETLALKLEYVNKCLKQYKINTTVKDIIKADNNTKYRNKMIIAFKYLNGKIISGFYEENSHKIVDIDYCLMHSDLQNEIYQGIKKIFSELKIKPYDEDKKTGLIRYVLIRESVYQKEVLITLVTSTDMFPARAEVVKRIKNLSPTIKTIIQNINPRKTSIVLGDKERILFGNGLIKDDMCGITFNLSSKSFYQINPYQTVKLYKKVVELAKFNGNETIIDAYSGVGTIGMILSKNVRNVISVENNRQAVDAAIINAKNNNIKNVRFVCDDATKFILNLSKEKVKLDAIIMDPPRSGSTLEFLNSAVRLSPKKIIYVSCDPLTLARDLVVLTKYYNINGITCVDMFCWTNHIETIVLLCLKDAQNTQK